MPNQLIYKIIEFELLCSVVDHEQVVTWADEQILANDEPEETLLELCVAKSDSKQLNILGSLNANLENEAFELVAIELLKRYESGQLNFFELANKLIAIHYHSLKLAADSTDFMIWLDDEACLVADGVKELESATNNLIVFLSGILKKHNKSKHADLVKRSPFLFQKSRQFHQTGV